MSNTTQMLLQDESNRVYAVQFSTNVMLTGPSLVTHPTSNAPQRFYRATVLR